MPKKKTSKSREQYHAGKMGALMKVTLSVLRKDPILLEEDQFERFRATMYRAFPELCDKAKCPNCDAKMIEYTYDFDVLDAVLLIAMGKQVEKKLKEGLDFTYANCVKVQKDLDVSYAVKSRTTQMSKLGLIAKFRGASGNHLSGHWLITKRGFKALRNEPVPKQVKVWRGNIEERFDEPTTIDYIFLKHKEKVTEMIKNKKSPKQDFRSEGDSYEPERWYEMTWHEGKLL